MQEAGNAIEDVAAGEETAEDLRIPRVEPFPSKFPSVLALDHREVIPNVRAVDKLINRGLEEERLAEAEGCAKTHGGVRHT